MNRSITIEARWDREANVWIATSADVHGLIVESETWPDMIKEVQLVLPGLLELLGHRPDPPVFVTYVPQGQLDLTLPTDR